MSKHRVGLRVRTVIATVPVLLLAVATMPTPVFGLSLSDVFNGNYRGRGQPDQLFNGSTAIIPRIINLMLFIYQSLNC